MAEVRIERVAKSFGAVRVIEELSLDVHEGEFLVLVGPSGCGKSTLLRMVAGLEEISNGRILIGERDVTDVLPKDRNIAMVFQSYALYPNKTVAQNLAFPLLMNGTPRAESDRKVREAAAILGLEALLDRKPRQLSGGQRQRVAMGRSIVRDPDVFLFDEPLSNLDAKLRVQMRSEIKALHRRLRATVIYVTHDQTEAMTMGDRIVVLNGGRIEQIGTPMELYSAPASLFVAEFIGSPKMNILGGPLSEREGAATIGIRPEHLAISQASGMWSGMVSDTECLGSDTFVTVEIENADEGGASAPVVARASGVLEIAPGARAYLTPALDHIHRFDAEGMALGSLEARDMS